MNRKSVDETVGVEHFNNKLFEKSAELIGKCKKIPLGEVSEHYKNDTIKKKYVNL